MIDDLLDDLSDPIDGAVCLWIGFRLFGRWVLDLFNHKGVRDKKVTVYRIVIVIDRKPD
jgi:hypothetical protein